MILLIKTAPFCYSWKGVPRMETHTGLRSRLLASAMQKPCDFCLLPMSVARAGRGLRHWVTNLYASSLISMILFNNAKRGARGKAATKMVVKPNCKTVKGECCKISNKPDRFLNAFLVPSEGLPINHL